MMDVVPDLLLNGERQIEVCHGCVGAVELLLEDFVARFNLPDQVEVNSKKDCIEHCISDKNYDDGSDLSFCAGV